MNRKAFKAGLRKLAGIKASLFLGILTNASYQLLVDAETSKEFHNLTGNTLTSFMVGIYLDGALKRTVSMPEADEVQMPKRPKLSRGNGIGHLYVEDYDSGRRLFIRKSGLMQTDGDYGYNTSRKFLQSYKPKIAKGYSIVMCTGTEYSEYLESSKKLNVLSETFTISPKALYNNLKPIPQ